MISLHGNGWTEENNEKPVKVAVCNARFEADTSHIHLSQLAGYNFSCTTINSTNRFWIPAYWLIILLWFNHFRHTYQIQRERERKKEREIARAIEKERDSSNRETKSTLWDVTLRMSKWCNHFFSELLYFSGRFPNTQVESCLSDLLISGDFPHFPLLYATDKIKWGQQPELYWYKGNIRATNRMQIRHAEKQITATFCAELPNTCILFCANSSISHLISPKCYVGYINKLPVTNVNVSH
jgi:hypothetical protein